MKERDETLSGRLAKEHLLSFQFKDETVAFPRMESLPNFLGDGDLSLRSERPDSRFGHQKRTGR